MASPGTYGVLTLFALIGGAVGVAVAKQTHSVEAIIAGLVLGAAVGLIVDARMSRRG